MGIAQGGAAPAAPPAPDRKRDASRVPRHVAAGEPAPVPGQRQRDRPRRQTGQRRGSARVKRRAHSQYAATRPAAGCGGACRAREAGAGPCSTGGRTRVAYMHAAAGCPPPGRGRGGAMSAGAAGAGGHARGGAERPPQRQGEHGFVRTGAAAVPSLAPPSASQSSSFISTSPPLQNKLRTIARQCGPVEVSVEQMRNFPLIKDPSERLPNIATDKVLTRHSTALAWRSEAPERSHVRARLLALGREAPRHGDGRLHGEACCAWSARVARGPGRSGTRAGGSVASALAVRRRRGAGRPAQAADAGSGTWRWDVPAGGARSAGGLRSPQPQPMRKLCRRGSAADPTCEACGCAEPAPGADIAGALRTLCGQGLLQVPGCRGLVAGLGSVHGGALCRWLHCR